MIIRISLVVAGVKHCSAFSESGFRKTIIIIINDNIRSNASNLICEVF